MKRQQIILAGVVLFFVGVVLAAALHNREPRYDGYSLTYWLKHVLPGTQSSEAFRVMGTNAIPYLVKALSTKESLYATYCRLYRKYLPDFVAQRLPRGRTSENAADLRTSAIVALMVYGPCAESARSALHAALEDEYAGVRRGHRLAMRYLAEMGSSVEPAVPALIHLARFHEAIWNDRLRAAEAVLNIRGPSPESEALLSELLQAAGDLDDVRSVVLQWVRLGDEGQPSPTDKAQRSEPVDQGMLQCRNQDGWGLAQAQGHYIMAAPSMFTMMGRCPNITT